MKFLKILKKIGLVVAAIIVILLVVALFIKKDYAVEREVTINKPKQEVFDYIKNLKNQQSYNKWAMADPNAKKEFTGTDGTIGFVYAWDGNNKVGKGEQEIKNISEGERTDCELRFKKPFENTAHTHMVTEAISANATKLKWGMEGKNPYPLNLLNLFIPGMLGSDMQTSLTTLKGVLEK